MKKSYEEKQRTQVWAGKGVQLLLKESWKSDMISEGVSD